MCPTFFAQLLRRNSFLLYFKRGKLAKIPENSRILLGKVTEENKEKTPHSTNAQMLLFLSFSIQYLGFAYSQSYSIDDFGAVSGIDTHTQAVRNGAAFASALYAANASSSRRSILVPEGKVYSFLPSVPSFENVRDVVIYLEGTLEVYTQNFTKAYPNYPNPWVPLRFHSCEGLSIISTSGKGLLNGRGNLWWWYAILVEDNRANLLEVDTAKNFALEGVSFLNSAAWHMWLSGQTNATVHGVTVRVDIEDQLNAYRYIGGSSPSASLEEVLRNAERIGPSSQIQAKRWAAGGSLANRDASGDPSLLAARAAAIPGEVRAQEWYNPQWGITPPVPMIWALNTDGIDFSGQGITVTNCSVTNFDDSVCVKPSDSADGSPSGCTSDVDIRDIVITYGVGVSMGSVPPGGSGVNCIDGVSARNLRFDTPIKALYIKPNPAKNDPGGDFGRIANVLYEDVEIHDALWWAIWVGTQQQQQPGTAGTGCSFLFPLFNSSCPLDPQVTLANITLRRVSLYNGLLAPGVIMANETNPGTGFLWDSVVAYNSSNFPFSDYLVKNIQGDATGGTLPIPSSFK